MLTVEKLAAYGADTKTGMERCMGQEAFYIRLTGMVLQEANFDNLEAAIAAGNLEEAFSAAHALKGVTGNLALTPLYDPIQEITELLRAKTETDYSALLEQIRSAKEELAALAAD